MRRLALAGLVSLASLAASCRTPERGGGGFDDVASRFQYDVPIETGKVWSAGPDRISILEIWGTRPRIEVGGHYLVRGTYTLKSADAGEVFFHVKGPSNAGSDLDLQHVQVRRGSGNFSVVHGFSKDGNCHVSLFAQKGSDYVPAADLYFGSGANVLRESK